MDYYDRILVAIPLALIGITGVLTAGGLATDLALLAGAIVAAGLFGHAMFVNDPVERARTNRRHVR